MENLSLWNRLRAVPEEAKKPIPAGRLKGFTDINPVWRIKILTEAFGPCGFGWWYRITDKHMEGQGTEVRAFVDIELFYVLDGKVSQPVVGTGGASFLTAEKTGAYTSDECYKMALTDAISVAAKSIGVAADVYYAKDRDKYTTVDQPEQQNVQPRQESFIPTCKDCGKQITDAEHDWSVKRYGMPLCREHQRNHQKIK